MSDGMSDSMKSEQWQIMIESTNDQLKNNGKFLRLIDNYNKYSKLVQDQYTAIKNKDFLLAHELEKHIKLFDTPEMVKEILELRRTAYGKDAYYDYVWERLGISRLFYFSR